MPELPMDMVSDPAKRHVAYWRGVVGKTLRAQGVDVQVGEGRMLVITFTLAQVICAELAGD